MSATFQCGACHATWSGEREPAECPYCKSRAVERWGQPVSSIEDRYGAPRASIAGLSPVSSTSFTVLYWLGWAGTILGFILMGVAGVQDARARGAGNPNANPAVEAQSLAIAGFLILLGSFVGLIAAYILALVKLYRGWKAIQPLRRLDLGEMEMPTAGAAVGLLFVPFYQFYWYFVAYLGLATRANKYMSLSKIDARPMSVGLAQTFCILMVCFAIPCLNFLALPVVIVVNYLVILDIDRMRGEVQAWQVAGAKAGFVDDLEAF